MGAYSGRVSEELVDAILDEYGIADKFYRDWLVQTGGGPIGADWFDGVDELKNSQTNLKAQEWTVKGFVVGWDGAGNPIVMKESGELVTEDHNFGGVHKVAKSFKELVANSVSS